MRTEYPPHLSDPELWIRRDKYETSGEFRHGFFWVLFKDGDIDLAWGNPSVRSVYAQGAGDISGLNSEEVEDFEWFAWLEQPKKD